MARTLELANGQHIGMSIAEITAIPYYALYDNDMGRANNMNQLLFTQITSAFHRKAEANYAALELLWQSVAVDNQTYKAQTKLFVIVRKIGPDGGAVNSAVDSMMQSIRNDPEVKNFSVAVLSSPDEFAAFEHALGRVDAARTLSVSKREKAGD